ncbi:MAG TPA: SAM-dependent methyltransferase [Verrucomicrobiae bacterium]|nr:SAM-dependent methyltransferase [Verrucomicrobiae bacterium]
MSDATNARDEFVGRVTESLNNGSFVRLVLSRCIDAADTPEKVIGRLVELKTGPHVSLTFRYPTRDTTKNLPLDQAVTWAREQIGTRFRSALLNTTKRDWQLFIDGSGDATLAVHKASHTTAPSRAHDQARQTFLDDSARDWLHGLGILNDRGNVRPSMADKHAQIHRYMEIFAHLAKECGWPQSDGGSDCPTIADMGCGKGYLTFAAWHLFARTWKQPAKVIGVEVREGLVHSANALARRIGAEGLEFTAGTIASAVLPKINALVALHACDTATDDAIRRGVEAAAQLIIVAPCCHKEVRPQLAHPEPLAPALNHGIMAERMAEWATDGLRGLFLEWAGYRTKMIEFVSTEHTPKNLMIAAVRHGKPFTSPPARARITEFKEFFGIQHHALDPLLLHDLGER